MNSDPWELFAKAANGKMQDFSRLVNISYLLMQTAKVPGAVCELGVFRGDTAALLASLKPADKGLWLFDSFQGLSKPGEHDLNKPPFVEGAMKSDIEVVRRTLKDAGQHADSINEKPAEKLTDEDMPTFISFAHCDVDLYAPTLHVLNVVWPRLSRDGIIVIDDYNHPDLPGIKKAVDEFLKGEEMYAQYGSGIGPRLNQPLGINGEPSLHVWIQK